MTIHLHLLPKALPDETLYSVVYRFARLNGLADKEACAYLFGVQDRPVVSDALVDLAHFCKATENAYGRPDEVLGTLTHWPFFRVFATHPSIGTPIAEPPHALAAHFSSWLGLAALSNSQPHVWRLCPACIAQDIETFGIAYWHMTHQLPGVVICLFHDKNLQETRLPYRARQKCFLGPEIIQASLADNASCQEHDPIDAVLEIARFAQSALNSQNCEITPAILRGVILDALRTMGLTNKAGVIHPKEFAAHFVAHHAKLADLDHFAPYLNTKALARLAKGLSAYPMMLPPTQSLLIAKWLFGSWERFHAHCVWRATIDAPAPFLPRKASRHSQGQNQKEHRLTCLAFMASAPSASRTDFWQAHPKACRWLAQFDSDWLESRLPRAKKYAPRQLELF